MGEWDDDSSSSMSDTVTEIRVENYAQRVGASLGGIFFGLLLLVLGGILLYWNEGRAVEAMTALKQGGSTVVEASPSAIDPALNGKLVHIAGEARSASGASDVEIGIAAPGALRLARKAEMYQWREDQRSESNTDIGGAKVSKTVYSYSKAWSDNYVPSSGFKSRMEHENPQKTIPSRDFESQDATLGAYRLPPEMLKRVKLSVPLPPDASARLPAGFRLDGGVYFWGRGSLSAPEVGDYRITYEVVPAQTLSLIGAASSGSIAPFSTEGGYVLALAAKGNVSADKMFQKAQSGESAMTWALRVAGFAMIWLGFGLLGAPIATLFAFLPFLEGIADVAVFFLSLMAAVPTSMSIIAMAWFAHRPVLSIALVAGGLLSVFALGKMKTKS